MEKLLVYSGMLLRCSSRVRGGTGTTEEKLASQMFVAQAFESLSEKHCAKARCVFCDVIYIMAVMASGDCGLSVITLKYCSGLNLYVLSSFRSRSAVDIATQLSIKKEHKSFSLYISAGIHHAAERTSLLLHTQ